jgi:hypothetical protein
MDFNFDINSVVAGVICSAIAYVFGGIFKLRIDLNQAFKKIRQLEKQHGSSNGKDTNESDVENSN